MFDPTDKRFERLYLTLAVLALLAGLVGGAWLLSACNLPPIPQPWPTPGPTLFPPGKPTATPTSSAPASPTPSVSASSSPKRTPTSTSTRTPPTATRTPVSPTPPAAATPFPVNSGKAVIRVLHADTLPLSPTNDNLILAVLTAETEGLDPNQPVLELAMRGVSPEPCLSRSKGHLCGKLAGLVPRYSANLAWDRTLDWTDEDAALSKSCGDSVGYSQRLALGALGPDGELLIRVEWNHAQITVATPADSVTISVRRPHSLRFGRVVEGAPWDRMPKSQWRSWLWRPFSALVPVSTVSWEAKEPIGVLAKCP